MVKIILMWILFIPVPVINGLLREKIYKKKVGEFESNIIGFFVLSLFFLLYIYLFFKNEILLLIDNKLLMMGGVWLALTLIFEFGIGILTRKSWSYILADYNILKGRLWPLFLIVVFFSPFIVKSILR